MQKFPFILDEISGNFSDRNFAIIIDEAHSSQGGRTAAAMSMALTAAEVEGDEDDTFEDQINKIIESKKLLSNASYFAFTATPEEPDPRAVRIPRAPTGRQHEAPAVPQLHDEAGDPGGIHTGRAGQLHAGGQLLQPGEEDRRRSRVRLQ